MENEQTVFEFAKLPTIKGYPELRWTGKRHTAARSITLRSCVKLTAKHKTVGRIKFTGVIIFKL